MNNLAIVKETGGKYARHLREKLKRNRIILDEFRKNLLPLHCNN